jgi:hypothetical protein
VAKLLIAVRSVNKVALLHSPPRGEAKPVKMPKPPQALRALTTEGVKAFMSGQDMADYCGDTKIVEGDESGRYRRRK